MRGSPTVLIILVTVGLCFLIAGTGYTSCYFTANLTSSPTIFKAWTSDIWVTTNTTEFNAGVPVNVNTSNDEVKLNRTMMGSVPYIYALVGGGLPNFYQYNPASNTWATMAPTPGAIGAGGALAYDGTNIYALAGGGATNFYQYNPASNTWQSMANTLAPINAGGALAFDGTYIYALAGGNSQNFTRYNPANNTWQGMANTLAPINAGGALAFDGTYIYALAGGNSQNFTRYNPVSNTWQGMANTVEPINAGGALTYGGTNFLYSMTGGPAAKSYYRYDITANTWALMAIITGNTGAGGALVYNGSTNIYAFRGNNQQDFIRYAVGLNTWATMTPVPISVNWGGSLVYVPGVGESCYSSPGTIASIVFDTTTSGSRWDVLAWNASLLSGTAITFEVRASDTSFDKNVISPPDWIPVTGTLMGSTYYVYYPLLPTGRYLQWRATLTSTVCANTPALYDVTVYYTDP